MSNSNLHPASGAPSCASPLNTICPQGKSGLRLPRCLARGRVPTSRTSFVGSSRLWRQANLLRPDENGSLPGSRQSSGSSIAYRARKQGHSTKRNDSPSFARRVCPFARHVFHFACHSPNIAPVGSVIILSKPMSWTSVTSFMTFAPKVLAFAVAVFISSTNT